MATTTIGTLTEFKPESEKIEAYLERVQLFFDANTIEEDKQIAVLLTVIGSSTYVLLTSLLAPCKPREKSFAELAKTTLRHHFDPKPLVITERFYFHRRNQVSGESISEYVAELRRLATHCEFGDYLQQALRDRFVCGIRHENTQKRLLTEANLTLTKAIETARSIEAAEVHASQLKGINGVPVMNVKSTRRHQGRDTREKHGMCTRCRGKNHQAKGYCYKDARCHKCSKQGHLAKMCRSKQPGSTTPSAQSFQQTNYVEETPISNPDISIYQVHDKQTRPFTVDLCIQGITLKFEVDTGAAVTLISEETYTRNFSNTPLQETSLQLTTYTKDQLQVLGQVTVDVSYGSQHGSYTLYVVKGRGTSLLGRDWMKHIRLDWKSIASTINSVTSPCYQPLLDKYAEVFKDELGTLKLMKAHLQVQSQATPKFHKPRAVPFALKEALERELARLQQLGVLKKVDHSEWAALIVIVLKGDGCLRVCGDYKVTINSVLVVDKYPLPKPEDLMARLAGGQKFSKLDLSHAYQQILLDDDSRKFVTINTHLGLFQYTRVPFGIASAPALFQKTMDTLLQGIPNTLCYLDDILITGKTDAEHLSNIEEVLKRLQENGLRVKPAKCKFMQSSVEYLGHCINASGVHTTDGKVEAILKAPVPQNLQQLRSFLGLLHYYGKFLPNLSSLLHPLNRLLKANARWKWSAECQEAFEQAKSQLVSAPVLAHYDVERKIKLAADASAYGLGAVISHVYEDGSERPIAYASRTLSNSEKNYA